MKILELEIFNIRGIRYVKLTPNGNNFIVWGPNGSGKSAVVDAIDFLMTGRITRLTGKGTGNITLGKHGPHIDYRPEDANVRAVIRLKNIKDPIEISRCMARPNELIYDEPSKPFLRIITALAHRGQHVLTRREILRYITAEGSTRAQEIQELMNMTDIEDIRTALVKAQNDIDKGYQNAKRNLESAQDTVNATVNVNAFDLAVVLEVVNQNRAIFGGAPIQILRSAQLKIDIKLPTALSEERPINVTSLVKDIENLRKALAESNQAEVSSYDEQLRSIIGILHSDPELLKTYSQQQLISLGLELIDETGKCPLCDTPWQQGKLYEHLERKRSLALTAEKHRKQIIDASEVIQRHVISFRDGLDRVIATAQIIGLSGETESLKRWQSNLNVFFEALISPADKYLSLDFSPEDIRRLLAPQNLANVIADLLTAIKAMFPETTPEQTAWDILTTLEANLKLLEKAEKEFHETEISYRRATLLLDSFQRARDKVLKNLYNSIKDRFVSLYKKLHGIDEDEFNASLEPDGAALNLEVDFYGRGTHPPHALHSEGHQDSMGLCLYLALAERLTEGLIDLLILDDIVMSVDADHRREICHLLAKEFPNRQFLITTHDKTWATQLKTEGIVNSANSVELYNWKVETGPQITNEAIIWEKIDQDIENNDIPSAAARLRRWSEQFFSMVCDALQAPVRYKLNGRWELGDYLPASVGQYRTLLKQAKRAAQSWNDKEAIAKFCELESSIGQIYSRINVEQWAINASVHYNNWANLSTKDFRPVIEVFQDIFAVFICNNCCSMLYVANKGLTPVGLRCKCGKVDWNLVESEKKDSKES